MLLLLVSPVMATKSFDRERSQYGEYRMKTLGIIDRYDISLDHIDVSVINAQAIGTLILLSREQRYTRI